MRFSLCFGTVVVILFSGVLNPTMAQPGISIPPQFHQFQSTQPLSNPATTGSSGHWNIFVNHQEVSGAFKGIRRYALVAETRLGKKDKENFHALGLGFIGKKDGPYIGRNWGLLSYAYHLKLAPKLSAALG